MASIKSILLSSFLLSVFFTTGQMSNSLILHYSFDASNAMDEVGNHHGQVNGPTLCDDRFGNPDMAYYFSNNSISADNLTFGGLTEASYSLWLEPDSATFTGGVATPMNCGVWSMYMNSLGTSGRAIAMMDGTINENSSSDFTSPLPTSGWFHFTATNDGSTTKIYVNGQLENQYPENFLWVDGSYNLYLGVRGYGNNAPADYYNGKIDDFRIYRKALSIEEIDSLYNAQNPVASIQTVTSNELNISIFPNPSDGIFKIISNDAGISIEWELYDLTGRKITSHIEGADTIDISNESDGVYILNYRDSKGNSRSRKIIKSQSK